MKILKIIGIVLLVLIAGLAIYASMQPSKVSVTRTTEVNAPVSLVYDQVGKYKNWEAWSPWRVTDPNMKVNIEGNDGEVGAKMIWSSENKNVGNGSLARTAQEKDKSITGELAFEGMSNKGLDQWNFESTATGGTKITWVTTMDMGGNLFYKLMGSMMEKMMGPVMDMGLSKIKTVAESLPKETATNTEIKIETVTLSSMPYLAIREKSGMEQIGANLGKAYGEIGAVMKKQGLKMTNAPGAIYYSHENNSFEYDAIAFTDKSGKESGNIKTGEIKAGPAVVAHYFGAYEKTGDAHTAIQKWMTANNKKATGAPWEIYITDPGVEKDTAKWQTDVYYSIE